MTKILFILFFVLGTKIIAWESLSCEKCSKKQSYTRSIGKSFKQCLCSIGLTSEDCFLKNSRIVWDETEWDSAYFTRNIIPDNDYEDCEYEEDFYKISNCKDYRLGISQIYADLNSLWEYAKENLSEDIKKTENLILKYTKNLEVCTACFNEEKDEFEKQERLNEIEFYKSAINSRCKEIERFREYIDSSKSEYLINTKKTQKFERKINNFLIDQYNQCWSLHQHPSALYERGMLYFSLGQTLECLENIDQLIEKAKQENAEDELKKNLLCKGQCQSELGLYQEAILSLTQLLQIDPSNKEAYFERAIAFFESGDIEASLNDYLVSGIKPHQLNKRNTHKIEFARGLSKGVCQEGKTAAADYIPWLFTNMKNLGEGLWAFAESPVQVSADLVDAISCGIEFVIKSTPKELVKTFSS